MTTRERINYVKIQVFLDYISDTVPQTFEELSVKLGVSQQSARATFKYINSLKAGKHPFLKYSKNGILKSKGLIVRKKLDALIMNRTDLYRERARFKAEQIRIKNDNLEVFEIVEQYHKNKACRKCKGLLELSRYYNCVKCKKEINSPIPQEYIDVGF